ncbi:MAG: hypothetical protein C4288_17220 [Leptolyngbya sp. ERB_1_1]
MTDAFQLEVQANLDRAATSIQAAKVLLETGYLDFAASRAYYAAFYMPPLPFCLSKALKQRLA